MKKLLTRLCMSLTLIANLFAMPMSVCAADNTSMTEGNMSATVTTATGGTTGSDQTAFVVAIPQNIELTRSASDFTKFTGTYQVNVKAVLANPDDYISVVPSGTFTMTKSGSATTATASVEQEHEKWTGNPSVDPYDKEILVTPNHDSKTDGSIEVTIEEAGEYTGTLGFTVSKGTK